LLELWEILLIMGIRCYEFVSSDSDTLMLLYLIKFTLILFMLLIFWFYFLFIHKNNLSNFRTKLGFVFKNTIPYGFNLILAYIILQTIYALASNLKLTTLCDAHKSVQVANAMYGVTPQVCVYPKPIIE
jgi:hypothetical protein